MASCRGDPCGRPCAAQHDASRNAEKSGFHSSNLPGQSTSLRRAQFYLIALTNSDNTPAAGLLHRLKLWYSVPGTASKDAGSVPSVAIASVYNLAGPPSAAYLATRQSHPFYFIEHLGESSMPILFVLLNCLFRHVVKTRHFSGRTTSFCTQNALGGTPKPYPCGGLWGFAP
jgi:hypothetical protein